MLPWIFVVLLALNLALFLWGTRNEHLREPPLPPVPSGRFEIRLLSEVEGERHAPGDDEQARQAAETALDPPSAPAALSGAGEQAPADDLIEPGGTGEESWVECELMGDTEAEALPVDCPQTRLETVPYAEPAAEDGVFPVPASVPEQTPPGQAPPGLLPPPTLDERPEPPPRDIPPFPELPIQQPRTPGGVSTRVESTA